MKKTRAFGETEFRETDVPVCLIRKGLQPETCRVRVYDQMDDWLIGILLDEPGQNFGYHKGEKVGIFPGRDADGNTFYYSNMTPDKELTEADLEDGTLLIPDILENGGKLYFPVFTTPAEMGEYGQDFSKVQKHFLEAILLASDNDQKVEGIVVNAFTDNFILPADLFDVVQNAKSRLVE